MGTDSFVAGFFAEAQKTMWLKFRGWEQDLPHEGEKGGIRERRLRDFLLSILPQKYGIGTGHIIDSPRHGNTTISLQTDMVVYDAQTGIVIPIDDYYSLFPCESVYAAIEVKSELNAWDGEEGPGGTIYECLNASTRLKALNRAASDLPQIHSIVFAYTTAWKESPARQVKRWFEKLGKKYNKRLPEVVFVLNPAFVLGTSGPSGYNEKGELTHLYEREPLLYFAADLLLRLSRTEVKAPNLWHEYVRWRPGDIVAKVVRPSEFD